MQQVWPSKNAWQQSVAASPAVDGICSNMLSRNALESRNLMNLTDIPAQAMKSARFDTLLPPCFGRAVFISWRNGRVWRCKSAIFWQFCDICVWCSKIAILHQSLPFDFHFVWKGCIWRRKNRDFTPVLRHLRLTVNAVECEIAIAHQLLRFASEVSILQSYTRFWHRALILCEKAALRTTKLSPPPVEGVRYCKLQFVWPQ